MREIEKAYLAVDGTKGEYASVNVTFREEIEKSQSKSSFRENEMYKISFAGPEAIQFPDNSKSPNK